MEKRLLPTAGLIVVQDHKLLLAYSKNKKKLGICLVERLMRGRIR